MRNQDFWEQISQCAFDKKRETGRFVRAVARDNGWRKDLARQVIEEYRRFLYLSAVSRTPLMPSDNVARVWRYHLDHPQAQWMQLCPHMLDAPVLGDGRADEVSEEVRAARYDATLDLYAKEFGRRPPRNVWPDPAATARHRRIAGVLASMCAAAFAGMTVLPPRTPDPLLLPAGILLVLALSLVSHYQNKRAYASV